MSIDQRKNWHIGPCLVRFESHFSADSFQQLTPIHLLKNRRHRPPGRIHQPGYSPPDRNTLSEKRVSQNYLINQLIFLTSSKDYTVISFIQI